MATEPNSMVLSYAHFSFGLKTYPNAWIVVQNHLPVQLDKDVGPPPSLITLQPATTYVPSCAWDEGLPMRSSAFFMGRLSRIKVSSELIGSSCFLHNGALRFCHQYYHSTIPVSRKICFAQCQIQNKFFAKKTTPIAARRILSPAAGDTKSTADTLIPPKPLANTE